MKVVPVSDMGRPPVQGRIRYGLKQMVNGKMIPRSILKFRFTSADLTALEQISVLYGGTIAPWERDQSELITSVSEIPIVLPPNPLGDGPVYELWKAGGCIRRCDGVNAWIPANTQSGSELLEVPCLCNKDQVLHCKPTTRLSVILPEVRFGGVWRLDSGGWHAVNELPKMVELAQQMQGERLSRAYLALEKRVKGKKQFVVPVIRLEDSVNTILSQNKELVSGSQKALETTTPNEDHIWG